MNYYLGVDGGGTKTCFILCNEKGQRCAQSLQPTCHYLQCGLDGVTQVMKDGLSECLRNANISSKDIVSCFAAIAGYGDIEKDCEPIEEAVALALGDIPFRVGNDTENALAGSLAGQHGINVIAGTGSIALGKDKHHSFIRCGGWHHAFGGDEGSAYWIACKLILHFTRQADYREPRTLLYEYVKKEYHLTEDSDILDQCVIQWNFDRTKVASMAKSVARLATLGDPIAIQIFQEAAQELAQLVLAIYRQLSFDQDVLVSYTGGVFQSGQLILAPFQEALSEIQHLKIIEPILPPELGSILLAMQANTTITEDILIELKGCN